jgi:hypothetical protein
MLIETREGEASRKTLESGDRLKSESEKPSRGGWIVRHYSFSATQNLPMVNDWVFYFSLFTYPLLPYVAKVLK